MKFSVLAIDYDGTIAQGDVLDSEVRRAIGELRAQGIVVVLVTGRILEDLKRVAGELYFVDAVVAENGAVVEFPDSGYTTTLGQPPPPALLEEMQRQNIPCESGRSVVEADALHGTRILSIVQKLELPLVLAFNRGRVMVLPQAISKATGLREALTIMRLSPHNAVAVGDAENDHELLRFCELGVAVAWGSETLKRSADHVLPGDGPAAVATYIRALAKQTQVPVPVTTRRRLLLGHGVDGRPLALAVRGRNILVAGDAKSGKSWVTGLLAEQLILYGYSLCILDAEGDYTSLEALPGVRVFGGADPLPRPRDLLRTLRHPDVSTIIDLSHTPHDEKLPYVRTVLTALVTLRRHTGLPHGVVLDEAHYFLKDVDVETLLDLELSGYTLVTYRASQLDPALLAASEAVIVTRESDPYEVGGLQALCRSCAAAVSPDDWGQLFGSLVIGEAVVLPITPEAEGEARRIRLAPRLTPHVRHLTKYIDIPVTEDRAFVFWRNGSPTGQRARTLREFSRVIDRSSTAALDGHLRRGDFSRWVAEVFGDYPLAKTISALEEDHRAGNGRDVPARLVEAVRSRYEFIEPVPRAPS